MIHPFTDYVAWRQAAEARGYEGPEHVSKPRTEHKDKQRFVKGLVSVAYWDGTLASPYGEVSDGEPVDCTDTGTIRRLAASGLDEGGIVAATGHGIHRIRRALSP